MFSYPAVTCDIDLGDKLSKQYFVDLEHCCCSWQVAVGGAVDDCLKLFISPI